MEMHISEEDYIFLKELQNEFLIQDTCGQASPRFWVIKDVKRIYGINEDYGDKYCICDEEGECWSCEDEQSLEDWFNEELENLEIELNEDLDLCDIKEVINWLCRETGSSYSLIYYEDEEFIVPDTMFLTLKEAKEHLKINNYHYTDKACVYSMTAWRSPNVKKLYEIIENLKFEEQ